MTKLGAGWPEGGLRRDSQPNSLMVVRRKSKSDNANLPLMFRSFFFQLQHREGRVKVWRRKGKKKT